MTKREMIRRIEAVMSKRCPRRKDSDGKGYPWRYKAYKDDETSISFAFEVPIGYAAKDLMQETDAIFAALGRPVELTDHAGIVAVKVLLKDLPLEVAAPMDLRGPSRDSVMLGYDQSMKPFFHSFRVPHLLVAGMSGYGKTDLLRWILFQLIREYSPDELWIDIIDGKGFSFLPFRNVPHVRRVVRDLAGAVTILEEAKRIQNQRSDDVWTGKVSRKAANFQWRIVLIDEAAQIAPAQMNTKEERKLAQRADSAAAAISCVGREARVGLLYCTQRPDSTIINGQVKANMEASLAFRTKTVSNSEIILDRPGAEKMKQEGRVIYSGKEDVTLQVPYIGDDDKWDELLDPYRIIGGDDKDGFDGGFEGEAEDYTGDLD